MKLSEGWLGGPSGSRLVCAKSGHSSRAPLALARGPHLAPMTTGGAAVREAGSTLRVGEDPMRRRDRDFGDLADRTARWMSLTGCRVASC